MLDRHKSFSTPDFFLQRNSPAIEVNMNTRRDFIEGALISVAAATTGARGVLAQDGAVTAPADLKMPATVRRGDMVYRQLGKTGREVSLIGLGGFHIGMQPDEQDSIRIIRSAIDRGITFLDNCWDYNNGASEIRMGKALQNGYRDKVFLMTKIDGRNKKTAALQIDESLKRLDTDHIDLVQMHEIIRLEDPDVIFAPGGAAEALLEAKKAGKIRHLGFTGHKDPYVHLRMLDAVKAHGFPLDTVQMPVNVMDAHFRSFQKQVLPRLVKEGIGPLAMKTFGGKEIADHVIKSNTATPIELLHYSMSQPVSVVITGCDKMAILDQALEAARTFKPMTKTQSAALLGRMKLAAMDGKHEKFKTSMQFDGTAHHPEWLGINA
jgi:aryl-alcohol dehydrogenase-like predicted oxidoreductase